MARASPPLDDLELEGARTLGVGVLGAIVLALLSLGALRFLAEPWSIYISAVLFFASPAFLIAWIVAVRRGYRIGRGDEDGGSGPNRAKRKLKAKKKADREAMVKRRMRG